MSNMWSMSVLASNSMQFIILSSCLLLFRNVQVHAQESCSNSANYTSNSQFQTNLNLLLRTLRSNGTREGFLNTSIGSGSDTVYGLVQCGGDISTLNCQACLNTTTTEITQTCPGRKEATLRYNECILRYSNQRFFSQVDNNRWGMMIGPPNVYDADHDRFAEQLGVLMNNLSSTAASRPNRYDSGSIGDSSINNIYGMVQCNRDLSPTGCQSCLQAMISLIPNCCTGKQGARIYSKTCYVRYESHPFVEAPPVSPPPPETTNNNERGDGENRESSNKVVVIIAPIVIAAVAFLAILVVFLCSRRKKWIEIVKYDANKIINTESLQVKFATVAAATDNFSDANKLGEGGFGAVYKGRFADGQEVAVKRLSQNSGQGVEEFKNEVLLLAKLQHRNLVRLLGFCVEGDEKLLIYEFVPNASLDKFLFDPIKCTYLDWEIRYKIIGRIARGLLYLHEDSQDRIIHRDLKASNVLLDGQMNPKIADFGMARLFEVEQSQAYTSRVIGTYGYMAPEYAMHGHFSVKSDVFSFGVLVLEIISGKRNNALFKSERGEDFLSYAWRKWQQGTSLELLDPTLREHHSRSEAMKCVHVALLCVHEDGARRPTMASVVKKLTSHSITLPPPSSPAVYYNNPDNTSQDHSLSITYYKDHIEV